MDQFIDAVNQEYLKISSTLQAKIKFKSVKNIRYFQKKNQRFINRLNREYLIPSEYRKYQSKELNPPIDVKIIQMSIYAYNHTKRCVKLLLEKGLLQKRSKCFGP